MESTWPAASGSGTEDRKQDQEFDPSCKKQKQPTFPAPVPPAIPNVMNGFVITFLAMGVNNIQKKNVCIFFLFGSPNKVEQAVVLFVVVPQSSNRKKVVDYYLLLASLPCVGRPLECRYPLECLEPKIVRCPFLLLSYHHRRQNLVPPEFCTDVIAGLLASRLIICRSDMSVDRTKNTA
jgi:hypothetical protein